MAAELVCLVMLVCKKAAVVQRAVPVCTARGSDRLTLLLQGHWLHCLENTAWERKSGHCISSFHSLVCLSWECRAAGHRPFLSCSSQVPEPFRGSQYPQQETESERNWLPATERLLCLLQAASYSSLGAKRGTRGSSYRHKCVITISCYEKPPMQQILVVVSFIYLRMN